MLTSSQDPFHILKLNNLIIPYLAISYMKQGIKYDVYTQSRRQFQLTSRVNVKQSLQRIVIHDPVFFSLSQHASLMKHANVAMLILNLLQLADKHDHGLLFFQVNQKICKCLRGFLIQTFKGFIKYDEIWLCQEGTNNQQFSGLTGRNNPESFFQQIFNLELFNYLPDRSSLRPGLL